MIKENMTFLDKYRYIKETIATMMDVQPITCVGQENPAKKEHKKCNHQKENSEHS